MGFIKTVVQTTKENTMAEYYDGTKLLSMKDIYGNKPEIYMCTTNRTGGKTTYFGRLLVNRFLKRGDKFILLYRFKYELDDVANKFFKDIKTLFFNGFEMTDEKEQLGIYHTLHIENNTDKTYGRSTDGKFEFKPGDRLECGYAISMNSADQLKKNSHLFSDAKIMLFDEFQSETNKYCPDEVKKFISIHQSIARGQGEQARYLPVIMIGNPVSLINPYYVELDICARLRNDTHFLRGDGFVLEQGFNKSASQAQKESGFNRAFSKNSYIEYSTEAIYLNDNLAFIEKPEGRNRYICTVVFEGVEYALREYLIEGIVYVDNSIDSTCPNKVVLTTDDHKENFVMLRRSEPIRNNMRFFYMQGAVRFKDLRCKQMFMKFVCL